MNFTLMHKDVSVAEMVFDDEGSLVRTRDVHSPEHMPYGTYKGGFLDGNMMRTWWEGRSIPASRPGLEDLLEMSDISDIGPIVLKSLGSSLSDHYWINPSGSELSWRDINHFENNFSDDVGDILFGKGCMKNKFDLSSPDVTTDGVLRKRWKIIDERRCLIKGGDFPYHQEPFNEVIASEMMSILGVRHVGYGLIRDEGHIYSCCGDMVDTHMELIPASRVCMASKKPNERSWFDHYLAVCKDHGLDVRDDIERMIIVDYIICNRDRHFNNFGIIRDSDSLSWIMTAPVFDSGSSLGSNIGTDVFDHGFFEECKLFAKNFNEQMKLISSFDWLDRESLGSIPSIVEEVLSDSNGWYLPERTAKIRKLVESRISSLIDRL